MLNKKIGPVALFQAVGTFNAANGFQARCIVSTRNIREPEVRSPCLTINERRVNIYGFEAELWGGQELRQGTRRAKVAELGVCPAVVDTSSNGLNRGKNGGRMCRAITGTFCGGQVQGSFTPSVSE